MHIDIAAPNAVSPHQITAADRARAEFDHHEALEAHRAAHKAWRAAVAADAYCAPLLAQYDAVGLSPAADEARSQAWVRLDRAAMLRCPASCVRLSATSAALELARRRMEALAAAPSAMLEVVS